MRFLFRLVFSLLFFIWRLFWRLVWTFVMLVLIGLGILWYVTGDVGQGIDRALRLIQVPQNTSGNPADRFSLGDIHQHTDAKWPQARTTVYINPQMDQNFQEAYRQAIQNWNQTGAFTFEEVSSQDQAKIFATEMNDNSTRVAGEAESQTNLLTGEFVQVTVRLNHYYLSNPQFSYSQERIIHTAEHELGHAIGLDHTEETSVMQSSGSFYGIQERDIAAVRNLYANS